MTATAILAEHELYGGKDPRNRPLYSFPEAGRATGIPASTLRAWFVGTTYGPRGDTTRFEPVIQRPDPNDVRVSFANLIEAHVLRALRTLHDVRMNSVREAVDLAQTELVLCSQSLFRFADLGDDGLCRGGPDKGCGVIVSAIDVVVDRLD